MLDQVRRKMEELGWTNADLARAMKVSDQRVWDIFNRRTNLSAATIQRLANALGIELVVRPEEGE